MNNLCRYCIHENKPQYENDSPCFLCGNPNHDNFVPKCCGNCDRRTGSKNGDICEINADMTEDCINTAPVLVTKTNYCSWGWKLNEGINE